MITPSQDRDWISLAEQVRVERDSTKLAILVKRLCCALEDRQRQAEERKLSKSSHLVRDSQHKSEFSLAGAVLYKKDPINCLR